MAVARTQAEVEVLAAMGMAADQLARKHGWLEAIRRVRAHAPAGTPDFSGLEIQRAARLHRRTSRG